MVKTFKKVIALSLMLCLVLCCTVAAFADDAVATPQPKTDYSRFEGKCWEDIVQEFCEQREINEYVTSMGYYNLVTGEEHYYNEDKYITAASMYKVPLNMLYAEKISKGEMTLESPIYTLEYSYLLDTSIIDSNNDSAQILWEYLGSYMEFRRQIAPYMGEDPDTVDWKFYENNFFTPKQVITCLVTLYNNPDRFPYIIDRMEKAEPTNYFRFSEQRYKMAHKYGYLEEDGRYYVNDCGIVYTDEPIALVMFTNNVNTLSAYCTLMCDYAQYTHQIRMEEEAKQAELAAQQAAEATPVPEEEISSPTSAPPVTAEVSINEGSGMNIGVLIAAVLVVFGSLLGAALVVKLGRKAGGKLAAAGILLSGITLLLCILAYTFT